MSLSKGKKRILVVLAVIIGALLIALIIVNSFLGSILEGKINATLQQDDQQDYHVSFDNVRINLLSGNIRLTGLRIEPDSSLIEKTKEGMAKSASVYKIEIPVLRLVGVELYDAIVERKIQINKIEFKRAKVSLLKGKSPVKHLDAVHADKKDTRLDSLKVEGIAGIVIGKIELTKCKLEILDLITDFKILAEKQIDTEFSGITFNKIEGTDDYFAFNLDNINLELIEEQYILPGGYYKLKVNKLNFSMKDQELIVHGLSLKPTWENIYEMAKEFHYTTEIFNIDVDNIRLVNIDLVRFVDYGQLFIDSVGVSKLQLDILMDKRLPFNEAKRPKLPNQLLKTMKFPLYVKDIAIINSELAYREQMPDLEEPMTVNLGNLNIHVQRATSINDSLKLKTPMKINLKARLMDKAHLNIDFAFPLNSRVDTFFYAGSLGPAHFPIFNKAAFPPLGVKFLDGNLNGITFKGSASPGFSRGEFTMLYDNLNAEVTKKDFETKNKFYTWAANAALKKSNPGKNGITRTALMSFERVYYKGFGNLMWKTLQNGIVNTISPVGKIDKELAKERKQEMRKEISNEKEVNKKKRHNKVNK